jgi:hypothetical protein
VSERVCGIAGCGRPVKARGWCNAHYQRWERTGDPGASAVRVQRVSRVRTRSDGAEEVWCPRCERWLAPGAFAPYAGHGAPYRSRCRACDAAYQTERVYARALRDPAWYEARLAKSRERFKTYRPAARVRRMKARQERSELVLRTDAWLRSRGFFVHEIAEGLLGVRRSNYQRVLRSARMGRAIRRGSTQRLLRLALVVGDVPSWKGRNGSTDKEHPWLPVLRARLEAMEAAA